MVENLHNYHKERDTNFVSEQADHRDVPQNFRESPEVQAFLGKLRERLPLFAQRAAQVPKWERYSTEWYRAIAAFL